MFSRSGRDGGASRGPTLSHRLSFFRELHPKAAFREILEGGQSCASSRVRRTTLVSPHILEGLHRFHRVLWVLRSLLDITQEDCGFHWGHPESDAVAVLDGAGSSRLPAHWLLWIHSLTWQSVSIWPTSRAEELLCEPYLMYTFGILQPGTVHFLHIVRTSPTKKWFSSYRCRIAPNLLKRPNCCWFVLWKCLNSLGGCQWP